MNNASNPIFYLNKVSFYNVVKNILEKKNPPVNRFFLTHFKKIQVR